MAAPNPDREEWMRSQGAAEETIAWHRERLAVKPRGEGDEAHDEETEHWLVEGLNEWNERMREALQEREAEEVNWRRRKKQISSGVFLFAFFVLPFLLLWIRQRDFGGLLILGLLIFCWFAVWRVLNADRDRRQAY